MIAKRSPYSYEVDLNGTKRHYLANHLRKFKARVESVLYDQCVYDHGPRYEMACLWRGETAGGGEMRRPILHAAAAAAERVLIRSGRPTKLCARTFESSLVAWYISLRIIPFNCVCFVR